MRTCLITRTGNTFPGSAFPKPIFRIPALTVTNSGRILVAYDVREDWRDLPADFDIAIRSCDDQGETWREPWAIRRHEPGHGFGDASLLTDPETGDIFCWYVGSTGHSYFSATADAPGMELWLGVSHDDGETWEHRNLSDLRPAGVAGIFPTSGNGAVLADGTLVQSFVGRIDDQNWAMCAHSTDHGETWQMGAPVGPDCDENKVLGVGNRVLMHARTRPARRTAWSADRGLNFTSPTPTPGLTDPACNGGLARVGKVLVASMCDDPVDRKRLSLHLSFDDGQNWSDAILVDSGATAYSVVAALDEQTLVLVWEADNYQAIAAATITLKELGVVHDNGKCTWDEAKVTLIPRDGTPGAANPPVVNPAS